MSAQTKILKDDWKARNARSKADATHAEAHNTIARMLNNLAIVQGGHAETSAQFIRLFCLGSGGTFTGVYWFKGKMYELTGTAKAYFYHDTTINAGVWSDGPLPDPMPSNQFWRETSACQAIEYIMC